MKNLVIIGGGAAGIGAGLEARRRGIDALIIEAGERLGGRARTIEWYRHKLDLGCGWLHSAERNGWRVEADERGIAVDRSPSTWREQFRDLGFSPAEQEEAGDAFQALDARLRQSPPSSDRASDALDPDCPWNAWLDAISGYINGAELSRISAADFLAYMDQASDANWRLPGGYGALIEMVGKTLDHRCAISAQAVSRGPEGVQIATSAGVIVAEHAIVTVAPSVLDRIRFDPPVADAAEAAADLPMGVADKLFLSLDRAEEFPNDAHLIGNPRSAETASYMIRPLGMPVVEVFFGGRGAAAVERAGLGETSALAVDQLAALLGSAVRPRLKPITMSRWKQEPWICGSYSHALPGKAGARARLGAAGDKRLAFAGEAVSAGDYGTAHGAFDSGKAAVERLYGER
jgi:monoamine oxidase